MNICQMIGCNNEVGKTKKGEWKKHCSNKCRGQHNSILGIEKRKQTCLERFGETTNLKTNDNKTKVKNTILEKYGVTHQMQVQSIKDKVKETCVEIYGVDNPSKSEVIKQKKIDSCLTHFGVTHPLKSEIVQDNRKIKSLEKYGVDHYSKTPEFKINHKNQSHIISDNFKKLKDPTWLEINSNRSFTDLSYELGVTKDTVAKSFRKNKIINTSAPHTYAEIEIVDYLKTIYSGEIITNTRKVIPPYELDIYLPDLNLAIEYNGTYWHSESNGKDKNYHKNKTEKCKEKDIRLIHILDLEWVNKKDIVKSRLSSLIGINETIYARKCKVVELSYIGQINFFNQTHIQGAANSTIAYGLYHNNELVAVMSFVKSRFSNKVEWELLRFSNKLNTSVIGGASKLFKHFIKEKLPNSVISYSDQRWNIGNLYLKLGFKYIYNSPPKYFYTKDYSNLESRLKYQKHKLEKILPVFDKNLTEWQNMQNNGFDRIWDCGNAVYMWQSSE